MGKQPLSESESQQYNEINRFFEFSLDLLGISGFDGYLKRINRSWERVLGYTTEELLSRPAIEFVHPDDHDTSLSLRKENRRGKPITNFENRYICKDGSIKWIEWTGYPYPEEGVNYIVGRDVTERKQHEARLLESEMRFRNLADAAPVLIWMADETKQVVYFNRSWVDYRQVDIAQDLGYGWQMSVHPDDVARVTEEYETAFDARAVFMTECRLKDAHGNYRWVLSTAVPRFSPNHDFSGYVGTVVDIHDRKAAVELARENEATLREFLDAFPGLIVVTELDGTLVTFNQQFAERYNLSDGDPAETNIYDLLSPANAEARKSYSQTVIETQAANRFQSESRGQFFNVTMFPIFDGEHRVVRIGSYVQDVSDLKRTENALHQSELTVRDLLNGSPDTAFLTDTEGRLIAFNKHFSAESHGSEADLIGLQIHDLLPPEFVSLRQPMIQRVLETRQPVREEIEYYGQFFDYTIYPITNDDQEVTSLATFSQDITQRKQFEQKLRSSEQRFRSVLESAAEAILLTDSRGVIVLVNRRAEVLFGYTREELLGQLIDVFLIDSQRSIHADQRRDFYAEPVNRPMGIGLEVFGRRKDGSTVPVEVSLSYLENDGEMLVMSLVSDISERKQIEKERLDNQRIQMEVKQEREIIALRQQFMSMVSHEFRTPLTVIASSTEILQHYDDRLSRERRMEKLQVINGQVRTMVSLLDDILALNKIQAGASDFAPESLDLLALCMSVLNNVKIMDQDQHQFIFDPQTPSAPVLADRRLLEHSITNLLSNAVKYSPPETTIHVSLRALEENVKLEIRDQGIGIPREEQKHLFEPFYRASNARKIDGTGLGLAIVKHNVEQHGGTITCQSAEGKGTTFAIHLPRRWAG